MKTAVLWLICQIWVFTAASHYLLPDGWNREWYGLPLFLTCAAIMIGTVNYYIDKSFRPKKD